jgi:hypothetical protein
MYDVTARELPERSLLRLKRNVAGEEAAWALGKEFVVALIGRHRFPRIDGRAGAPFCIYLGRGRGGQRRAPRVVPARARRARRGLRPPRPRRHLPLHRPVTVTSRPDCDCAAPLAGGLALLENLL